MNELGEPSQELVRARHALLDALEALGNQRDAVVLVGAQAVYLRVGAAREALSSFTLDADLAMDPALLSKEPALEASLLAAGFERKTQPGLWFNSDGVEVDILVPSSLAGSRHRAVDLGQHHDRMSAMRAAGLEACLIDNGPMTITSFEESDKRIFELSVAGAAALLVAKLYKIGERTNGPASRLKNKDASDLYLILERTDTEELARKIINLKHDARAASTIPVAMQYLDDLSAEREGTGLDLLRDAIRGLEDEDTTTESCLVLAQELVSKVRELSDA